jgi:hypothetical protein
VHNGFVHDSPGSAGPERVAAFWPHIGIVLARHYFDQRLAGRELILLDAREKLSQFVRNGMADATLFRDAMIPASPCF